MRAVDTRVGRGEGWGQPPPTPFSGANFFLNKIVKQNFCLWITCENWKFGLYIEKYISDKK